MPPALEVTSAAGPAGSTLVVPRGEVDAATVSQLAGALEGASAESGSVVLDLREIDFMDSSGLRIVVTAAERAARDSARELLVVRGPRRVQRVFEVARVAERIRWLDDPAELAEGG